MARTVISGVAIPGTFGRVTAELVYVNGRVHTVDPQQPSATAFAVSDGRFVAVGTDDEMKELVGPDTQVVDLRDNLVLPGLIDDHMHPDMAAENYFNVNIDAEADTWDDVVATVQQYLADHPDADWVFDGLPSIRMMPLSFSR